MSLRTIPLVVVALGVSFVPSALMSTATGAETRPLSGIVIPGATGDLDDDLSLDTAWECRPGSNLVGVELSGPGLTTTTDLLAPVAYNDTNAPANSTGGFHLEVPTTLAELFTANGVEGPNGDYVLTVNCGTDADSLDYWGGKRLRFTSDEGGTSYEQMEPVRPVVTIVPAFGSPVVYVPDHPLHFTVSLDPSEAQGVIDFDIDGGFVPGKVISPAPVLEDWLHLSPGTHAVKAKFTQTHWYAYRPASSQPATVVVAGPTSMNGTARFGSTLTCSSVSGATRSFTWILDGSKLSVLTTASVKVPLAWVGRSVGCRIKTADSDSSVTVSSQARAMQLAAAPVVQDAPAVRGIARRGEVLTCSRGQWSPTPTSFTYQWRRNGVPLSGANGRQRLVTSADRGQLLSCVVGAHLPGHLVGRATSPKRRVAP